MFQKCCASSLSLTASRFPGAYLVLVRALVDHSDVVEFYGCVAAGLRGVVGRSNEKVQY